MTADYNGWESLGSLVVGPSGGVMGAGNDRRIRQGIRFGVMAHLVSSGQHWVAAVAFVESAPGVAAWNGIPSSSVTNNSAQLAPPAGFGNRFPKPLRRYHGAWSC